MPITPRNHSHIRKQALDDMPAVTTLDDLKEDLKFLSEERDKINTAYGEACAYLRKNATQAASQWASATTDENYKGEVKEELLAALNKAREDFEKAKSTFREKNIAVDTVGNSLAKKIKMRMAISQLTGIPFTIFHTHQGIYQIQVMDQYKAEETGYDSEKPLHELLDGCRAADGRSNETIMDYMVQYFARFNIKAKPTLQHGQTDISGYITIDPTQKDFIPHLITALTGRRMQPLGYVMHNKEGFIRDPKIGEREFNQAWQRTEQKVKEDLFGELAKGSSQTRN